MPFTGMSGKTKRSKEGGCATWDMDAIWALKGGNTCEFWKYTAATDSWQELDTMPSFGSTGRKKRVKSGGDIVGYAGVLFALKGNKTNECWRYVVPIADAAAAPPYDLDGPVANGQSLMANGLAIGPNPHLPGLAAFRYSLPVPGLATVRIFDVAGREVKWHSFSANRNGTVTVDLRGLARGVYLVKLTATGFSQTRKLVIE